MDKLRLLFVLGLSLALPWSGCDYIHQKEQLMRSIEADKLLLQAQQLASSIEPELLNADVFPNMSLGVEQLYLYKLAEKIQLDGFHDDWGIDMENSSNYSNRLLTQKQSATQNMMVMTGHNSSYLYLFFQVSDNERLYSSLQTTDLPADHIVLDIKHHTLAGRYFIQVSAPGKFVAFRKNEDELGKLHLAHISDIQGYWQDTATGFNVELRIPKSGADTQLGFSLYDYDLVDMKQASLTGQYGNQLDDEATTALLIKQSAELQALLQHSQITASRMYILNTDGWILARELKPSSKNPAEIHSPLNQALFDILSQVYIFISNLRDTPAPALAISTGRIDGQSIQLASKSITSSNWYKRHGTNQPMMSITVPVKGSQGVQAIIVIEQNSSAFLSLQNPDFVRNIAYSLLMICILCLLMFIYTWKLAHHLLIHPVTGQNP